MTYKPLTDEALVEMLEIAESIVKERLHATGIVLARVEVPQLVEQARRANKLAEAAAKITVDSGVLEWDAFHEALAAYRGDT